MPVDVDLEELTSVIRSWVERDFSVDLPVADSGSAASSELLNALSALRSHYEAAIEHCERVTHGIDDAVILCSSEGTTINRMNGAAERLYGHSSREAADQPLHALLDSEFLSSSPSGMHDTLAEHGYWQGELAQRCKDGRSVVVDCQITALPSFGELLVISRDVTGTKTTTQGLMRAASLASLGRIMGGIAHELNNPLMAIGMFAEVLNQELQNQEPDTQECRNFVAKVLASAERCDEVVTKLVQFRDPYRVSAREIDVLATIHAVLRLLAPYVAGGRSIALGGQEGSCQVIARPGQLEQILVAILTNALEASSHSDTVRIELSTREGECLIRVLDAGPGVDERLLPKLIEPFFTTKSVIDHQGLGLTLADSAIRELGGTLEMRSDLGVGTSVCIRLPLAEVTRRPTPQPASGGSVPTCDILFLDDEPDLRDLVLVYLRHSGYAVDTASSGREALAMLQSKEYGCILTDKAMPGMSGFEFLERVRELGTSAKLILLSGYLEESDYAKATALGVSEVIHKPIQLAQLKRIVETVLGETSLESE